MGVDYTANYGVGIKILEPDYEELGIEEGYQYMEEYIDEHLPDPPEGLELEYFEVGQEFYSGEVNDFYLCFKYSIAKDGTNALVVKKILFEQYLKDNNIETEGEVDIVGGLKIW